MLQKQIKRHNVDLVTIQEHHKEDGVGLEAVDHLFRQKHWGTQWNLQTKRRETGRGVGIMWDTTRWRLENSYSLSPRLLVGEFVDCDGVGLTVLSGHFHHNTEKRRKQWGIVNFRTLSPLLIGADCNSLLNPLLDAEDRTSESDWIARARTDEVEHHRRLGVQDLWGVLYRGHDSVGHGGVNPKGYTRGTRRIDRWMATAEVLSVADGAYTIPVAHSDHLGLVMQLVPPPGPPEIAVDF